MRKLLCVLIFLIFFNLTVNANTVIFEDDLNEATFNENEFWANFNCYNANEGNYIFEGENGYYNGKWTEGASALYVDELEDYTLIADFKTSGNSNATNNCYKSAIVIRVPTEANSYLFEPDNGDEDATSFLGSSGIYFYCFGNTLEVSVHTKKNGGTAGPINAPEGTGTKGVVEDASVRSYGVYSMSCYFTLPEGKTFDQFTKIKLVDKKDKVSFYVEDKLICDLLLTDLGEVKTVIGKNYWQKDKVGQDVFAAQSYKTIVVKDDSGNEVMKVEEAVVAPTGLVGFANRANSFMVDNIKLELNYDITPSPTQETTPTPDKTEIVKTIEPTNDKKDNNGQSNKSILMFSLIGAGVLVIAATIFILIKTSDKNNK